MLVLRIYGALASLIDVRLAGLVHESVIDASGVRFRHERFLVSRLVTGLMMMLALPPYLVLRGVPTGIEALAMASLMLPVFAAVLLSRTGILWLAHAISSAGLTSLVVCLAMMTGGAQSAAAIWLVAIPLEAIVSGSRRATLAAAIIAGIGALAVALMPPLAEGAPFLEWSRALAMPVFAITAIGHIAAQATEHFRHEGRWLARLRDNERRDRMLLSAIDDLVTWHDQNGRVLEASASAARFVGAEAAALQGHGLLERVHVADRPLLLQALSDVAAHGRPATVQFRLNLDPAAIRAEGASRVIFAEMRMHRIGESNPEAAGRLSSSVVAVTRDVTEHRRRAEELEQARAEAERADELKTRFLANVSHELRTPLNAIIGFSEIMGSGMFGTLGSDKYQEYCTDILTSGHYLLEVINDILDMSKIEAGRMKLDLEPLDLAQTLAESLRVVSGRADDKNLTLSADIQEDTPVVADRRAIKQILVNLLSNAVKFTPDGGRITVRSRVLRDSVVLMIADSGIGIAPHSLRRLGRPFEQVESQLTKTYHGSGLGLAIAKSLTSLHGGSMKLRSRLGIGTVVCVSLPRQGERKPAKVSEAA